MAKKVKSAAVRASRIFARASQELLLGKSQALRRIKADLEKSGVNVGRWSVRRLMGQEGLRAIQPKRFKPRTTDSKGVKAAANLLAAGKAEAAMPSQHVIGDITYLPLKNGKFCYLAVWQDKVSRKIIGWRLAATMKAALVSSALEKARHKGAVQAGASIHLDRGAQYAAAAFRSLLRNNCLQQSMSGKGNCYDNAQAESFFSRFKTALLEGGVFEDVEQAGSEVFSYLEGYHNRVRLHSGLGYKSPMEYEAELKTSSNERNERFCSIKT